MLCGRSRLVLSQAARHQALASLRVTRTRTFSTANPDEPYVTVSPADSGEYKPESWKLEKNCLKSQECLIVSLQDRGQCGRTRTWDHSDLRTSASSCQGTPGSTATWKVWRAKRRFRPTGRCPMCWRLRAALRDTSSSWPSSSTSSTCVLMSLSWIKSNISGSVVPVCEILAPFWGQILCFSGKTGSVVHQSPQSRAVL